MIFKMREGSLFSVLLRSPWWYSVLIAFILMAISILVVGSKYLIFGIALALPFLVLAVLSGYRQLQRPGQKRVLEVAELARGMPAKQLAGKIASHYEKQNFDITPFKGNAADLELERGRYKFLLCCKRFKAANTGIEPLKQLVASGEKIEATGYLYVALGTVTDNARTYARQNDIELIQAEALAEFFDDTRKPL